jgi:nucleoside-diphosphate-sugar epimerase
MRIFLTGGTGYIGSAILDAFVRGGHQVTALARNSERAAVISAHGGSPIIGDLAEPNAWVKAAEGQDAIVHAAIDPSGRGPELDGAALGALLPAARRGAARPGVFIYTSGAWVLGPTRVPAAEDAPTDPTSVSAWRAPHEQQVLSAAGDELRTVVVRPGIVYGGTRGIVGDLFRNAMNGLVRVIGSGDNHWPLIYDRDLGDLYVRLATHPEASGIFHANDEGDERVNDIVEAIVEQVPNRPDVRRIALEEARVKLGPSAAALAVDQLMRSPRARALGWAPTLRCIVGNTARLFEEWRAQEA